MPLDETHPAPTFTMDWVAHCPDGWSVEDSDIAEYASGFNGIQSPDGKQWSFCENGSGVITIGKNDDGTTERGAE